MEDHLRIENGKLLKKKLTNVIFFAIIATIYFIMVVVGESFYKRSFSYLGKHRSHKSAQVGA